MEESVHEGEGEGQVGVVSPIIKRRRLESEKSELERLTKRRRLLSPDEQLEEESRNPYKENDTENGDSLDPLLSESGSRSNCQLMMGNPCGDLGIDAVSCPQPLCSSSLKSPLSSSSSIGPVNRPDSSRISTDQSAFEGIGKGHEKSLVDHVALQAQVDELKYHNRQLLQEVADLPRQLDTANDAHTSPLEMNSDASEDEERNDEASEAPSVIFKNSVILQRILELFRNSELRELSFVSKFWMKESRIVMKKRGSVVALLEIDCAGGCGQVFRDFAANLETLNESMYSGLTIRLLRPGVHCEGTGAEAVEVKVIHESILAGMRGQQLNRLTIEMDSLDNHQDCWKNRHNCPNFLLLGKLLRSFMEDLKHLSLNILGVRSMMQPFIQHYLPHGPYTKLQVLKLSDHHYSHNHWGNQIRLLLSRAPNLKEIHTNGPVNLSENLMEGREGVVLVHEYCVSNPMEDISEEIISALRLKRVAFDYNDANINLERWSEKAESLLTTCCASTLQYLKLGDAAAILFMSYGIQLANVDEFTLELYFPEVEQSQPRILNVISRFDFNRLLPNLKKVEIRGSGLETNREGLLLHELPQNVMEAIIEQGSVVPIDSTLARARNIKFLELEQDLFTESAVCFFADMFPSIVELQILGEDFPIEYAWDRWEELKLIKVGFDDEGPERYERP